MPSPLKLEYRKRYNDLALTKKSYRIQVFKFLERAQAGSLVVDDAFYRDGLSNDFPIDLIL